MTPRIAGYLTFIGILFMAALGDAAPAYGPKLPDRNQIHFGFQSYTIFERELDREHGEMRSQQQFMLISYGITDWLSLDVKGGDGNIERTADNGARVKNHTFVGGGYGFRIKWLDTEKTDAVFGFQHISIHPRTVSIAGVKNKAILDDWQWSLLIGHRLGLLQPYAGVRWSRMDYIRWVDGDRKRVKSDLDRSVGALLGVNLFLKENIWINIEGSAFDAEAVAASVNFHF